MSDFLGTLAARSIGQATDVRPRLRSRFEPVEPQAAALGLDKSDVSRQTRAIQTRPQSLPQDQSGEVESIPAVHQAPGPQYSTATASLDGRESFAPDALSRQETSAPFSAVSQVKDDLPVAAEYTGHAEDNKRN